MLITYNSEKEDTATKFFFLHMLPSARWAAVARARFPSLRNYPKNV